MSNKTLAALQERLAMAESGTHEHAAVTFLIDIHTRMLALGLTHVELAQRMGTSRSYITQLFGGKGNLSMLTMGRLADAVACTLHVRLEDAQGAAL